ncbi:MAG: ATP phosphoribosyltransferase [Chloroflexi bacterium]|nr:ATP phosphoribosyltransferase [Chloroflexota bacterium]
MIRNSSLTSQSDVLRLAIPSKGILEDDTIGFLRGCGLPVDRSNPRQYRARLATLTGVEVTFQRASDIFAQVDEGNVELGITGYDIVAECRAEDDRVVVLMPELGFSQCSLVLAVPETWIDVWSIHDVAEICVSRRSKGQELRVATKYPNLARQYLYDHGVNYFMLVESSGALEAGPALGSADVIADLTSTGVTLRENRLKTVAGGTILTSEACLIANREELAKSPSKLERTRLVLEAMEAYLRARPFLSLTANVQGGTAESVARKIIAHGDVAGLRGPTVARVFPKSADDDEWFAVTVIVAENRLQEAVDALRRAGALDITSVRLSYVFESKAWSFEGLVRSLHGERADGGRG